ncbi:MAG: hypothetical protein QOJ21_471 [Solirubrobacteraceae bacterium]|nr:hypothetical protein [Solirubrobacteraceae bacterium]
MYAIARSRMAEFAGARSRPSVSGPPGPPRAPKRRRIALQGAGAGVSPDGGAATAGGFGGAAAGAATPAGRAGPGSSPAVAAAPGRLRPAAQGRRPGWASPNRRERRPAMILFTVYRGRQGRLGRSSDAGAGPSGLDVPEACTGPVGVSNAGASPSPAIAAGPRPNARRAPGAAVPRRRGRNLRPSSGGTRAGSTAMAFAPTRRVWLYRVTRNRWRDSAPSDVRLWPGWTSTTYRPARSLRTRLPRSVTRKSPALAGRW